MNIFKIILALLLVAAGIAGFHYLTDLPVLVRYLIVVVAVVLALGVVSISEQGRKFWKFAADARNEVRKVIWPTTKETTQVTTWVVIVVFLVGLMIWIIDWMLVKVIYNLVLGIDT